MLASTSFRLPPELLERMHAARGDVPLTRWVIRACEERLAKDAPSAPAVREAVAREIVEKPARKPPKAPRGFDHAPTCRCGVCKAA